MEAVLDKTNLETLRKQLATVSAQHAEAKAAQAQSEGEWTEAAGQGDSAKAETLEGELGVLERRVQRLAVQRDTVAKQIAEAEAAERANHALVLKQQADGMLEEAGWHLVELERLAKEVAEVTESLRSERERWREARFLAKQAGAKPEGFSTQESNARVQRIVDSLSRSKNHIAGSAAIMGRLGLD